MSNKSTPKTARTSAQIREDRLKAALKANLGRRKAQARQKAQTEKQAQAAQEKE